MHRKIPIFLRELVFGDPQIQFFGPLRGIFERKPGAPARGVKRAKKHSVFFLQNEHQCTLAGAIPHCVSLYYLR